MWRRRLAAGVVDRLRFDGRALVKGWPLAWALVTVLALVFGVGILATIAFALREPILALAILLAGLLLTLAEGAYRLHKRLADARNDEAEVARRQLADEQAAHQHQVATEQAAHEETRRRAESQRAELENRIAYLERRMRLRNELVALRNDLHGNIEATAELGAEALDAPFPNDRARGIYSGHLRQWIERLDYALKTHGVPEEAAEFRLSRVEREALISRRDVLHAYKDRLEMLDKLLQPDHELWTV
jgi:hypothetical protein